MAGLWKKFNPANDLYDQPLAYRGTIAPFGTYTNPDGSESAGFAWPGMITEPLNALQRLHENSYTEDGRLGMPNPQYQGNKDDALTSLLSIYGGNALNPMAKVPANALASSAFKVEGKPALSKFLRHDEDKSLGDTEVTRYLLNLADEKVARIPADVTRGSESFGLRGFKRSLPPDTVTQKGYDFHGMHHPELDDYVQYKNLWHSQDGLLNHIDKLSERVARFGLRGHLTPQEVANSKAYYQKLRDHVSSDDWDGSVFSDTGRPSIAGSAVAGAEAKGARPEPSALQPKAEAMGDGIIAETVDDAYRTFLSKLQDDPQPTPTFGPPTPGVDPTKVREAFEIGLQRWHRSFGKYSKDVPSPYGPLDGRLGDDLPAVMDALKLASEAAGRQLNVVPRRYGSQYANLRTPTGDSWEVRVADHANQSVHHGESDFNIAPGGMTQEQFLELLPTIYSDTGRPSIAGSAIAAENANAVKAWHSTPAKFDTFDNAYTDEVGFHFGSKNQAHNRAYVESGGNPWTYFTKWRDIPVEMDVKNPANISRDVGQFNGENVARQLVKDSIAPIDLLANVMNQPEAARNAAVRNWLVENGYDAVKYPNRFEGVGDPSYMMLNTGNVRHARTGDTLYSDTGRPSIAGATAASADQDEISLDEFLRRYGVTY